MQTVVFDEKFGFELLSTRRIGFSQFLERCQNFTVCAGKVSLPSVKRNPPSNFWINRWERSKITFAKNQLDIVFGTKNSTKYQLFAFLLFQNPVEALPLFMWTASHVGTIRNNTEETGRCDHSIDG